jgi:hypothetical protein
LYIAPFNIYLIFNIGNAPDKLLANNVALLPDIVLVKNDDTVLGLISTVFIVYVTVVDAPPVPSVPPEDVDVLSSTTLNVRLTLVSPSDNGGNVPVGVHVAIICTYKPFN